MKKLMIIMLCVALGLQASAKDNSGFRVQGGFGLATMYFGSIANSYSDAKSKIKPGGFVGVGYELRVVKFLAIQPEVNYLNRGAKREFSILATNQRAKLVLSMHTIEIPLLLKFYIGNHFNLYGGPAVTFNLAASTRSKFYNLTTGNEESSAKGVNVMKSKYKDSDGNSPYKKVDFGVVLGLEAVIVKGFFVGGRISQGILDQTNNKYKGYVTIPFDGTVVPAGDGKWVGSTSANLYAGYRF
ncbi:MAG: hypothetical protein JWN78_2550 [Bacteroidota bacterium]|nr:hypothetical protein [Bacteroidota bacterium]